jgi:hypothetical protein
MARSYSNAIFPGQLYRSHDRAELIAAFAVQWNIPSLIYPGDSLTFESRSV